MNNKLLTVIFAINIGMCFARIFLNQDNTTNIWISATLGWTCATLLSLEKLRNNKS